DHFLREAVSLEERPSGVGPVDLETLVLGAVTLDEADVMEHRTDVEELGVVGQAESHPLERGPEEHAPRMVEQKRRGDVFDELRRLAGKRAVGDRNSGDGGLCRAHARSIPPLMAAHDNWEQSAD